jgi:hypothetical protein
MRQAYVRPGHDAETRAIVLGTMPDKFDDLAAPSGDSQRPHSAADLTAEIVTSLSEPEGRLAIVADDEEMAWLLRDGVRLSWFNLKETDQLTAERRARFVQALAKLVRRYEEMRSTVKGLEVGRRYVIDYKSPGLEAIHRGGRSMRVKGTLLSVSGFRYARGVSGAGWVLTLEYKPTFGDKNVYKIDTSWLLKIRRS